MNVYPGKIKRASRRLLLLCALSLAFGCASPPVHSEHLPPLLTQDELLRPYDKVAAIQVQRERYGFSEDLDPQDYSWAYHALRQEAARIGSDAVILPEVTVHMQTFTFWPTSEMTAKGIAIKFH
jgi:hypothetical protein